MTPNTSVLTIVCILPLSSGLSSSSTLLRDTTISCAFGALKLPYTAHCTPPPFCRVRLYRNMVAHSVARATRRTPNRLRLSLAPTSSRAPRNGDPREGLDCRLNKSSRVWARRVAYGQTETNSKKAWRTAEPENRARPPTSFAPSRVLTSDTRGCARTLGTWLWATEVYRRDASSRRVRGRQGSDQGARMRPRGSGAVDRPRNRVSWIRVGGSRDDGDDGTNGRVDDRSFCEHRAIAWVVQCQWGSSGFPRVRAGGEGEAAGGGGGN